MSYGSSQNAIYLKDYDWSKNKDLGEPGKWPDSLHSALKICLSSKLPMSILWGKNFLHLYNDAFNQFLGVKHPAAMMRPAREVWPEVWDHFEGILNNIMQTGESYWSEDLLLYINRNIPKEAVYTTFSFCPILGKNNAIEGVLCISIETTKKILTNRRLEVLRRLSLKTSKLHTVEIACKNMLQSLSTNCEEINFSCLYQVNEFENCARLIAVNNLSNLINFPELILLNEGSLIWPHTFKIMSHSKFMELKIDDVSWESTLNNKILVFPIYSLNKRLPLAYLIIGISHFLVDEQLQSFMELIAIHFGVGIEDAKSYENERNNLIRMEEITREKTDLFNALFNELKSPISSIILLIDSLKDKIMNQNELAEKIKFIQANANHLLNSVNNNLNLINLNYNQHSPSFELTDISYYTEELVNCFRTTIECSGLSLTVNCQPTCYAYIDHSMWEVIVYNLFSNAFKYTSTGEIVVSVSESSDFIKLSIKNFKTDRNINFSKSESYIDNSQYVKGFSLVQEFVHIHGGKISFNCLNRASIEMVVSIPLGYAHLPKEKIVISNNYTKLLQKKTYKNEFENSLINKKMDTPKYLPSEINILVVDHNEEKRRYISYLLVNRWNIDVVSNRDHALSLVKTKKYHIILIDIMIPTLDGIGIIKQIKKEQINKDIAVIMLSSRADENSCIEGLKLGADDYLIKPFSLRELEIRIDIHLRLLERRNLIEENDELTRLHEISSQLINKKALSSLLQAILLTAIELANADLGDIQLYDPSSNSLHLVTHQGFDGNLHKYFKIANRENSVCKVAATTLQKIFVDDIKNNTIYSESGLAMLNSAGVINMISVPLIALDGRVLGVFSAYWKKNFKPNKSLLKILDLFAHEAANLIQHRQNEEILFAEKIRAEEKNHAKDLFIAMLSHELRSPLTAILTWSQLLKNEGIDAKTLSVGLSSIEENALSQNKIINDLLDISAVILGKLSIDLQPTNINSEIVNSINSIRPSAQNKKISIKKNLIGMPIISCDPIRIRQVFCNILSNAIKYTAEEGKISVISKIVEDEKKYVQIEFIDNGKGINKDFLATIFNLFNQEGSIKSKGGLGLGLALAASLIKLHGGKIFATSEGENKGSTFVVQLPLL